MPKYNAQDAKPYQREEVPAGTHDFVIVSAEDGQTSKGDEKVTIQCMVDDQEFNKSIRHTVTFHAPDKDAAGITLHFLKTIGEPYSGEFETQSANWVGRRFRGQVVVETANANPKFNGPKIKAVYPAVPLVSDRVRPRAPKPSEEVPF